MRTILLFLFSVFILISPHSKAEEYIANENWKDNIPKQLKDWIPWVMKSHKQDNCPFGYNDYFKKVCFWPVGLSLSLGSNGGSFEQLVVAEKKGKVFLPGEAKLWPQEVKANDTNIVVLKHGNRPYVHLEKGTHKLSGKFYWKSMPSDISVPPNIGLLNLKVNNKEIDFPNVNNNGKLWLKKTVKRSEEDHVDIKVYRKITDDIPSFIETRMVINVSGKSRDIELSNILFENDIPIRLTSQLPIKVNEKNDVMLQVRPGRWTVNIHSYQHQPLESLTLKKASAPWPKEELWVFQGKANLRVVQVEGVPSIDPAQTDIPVEWRKLPVYHVKTGDKISFVQKKRGESKQNKDSLELNRDIWLDFDGGGYTIKDYINGVINESSRLEVKEGFKLGKVNINGVGQFITKLDDGKNAGIEVREGHINLEAEGRVEEKRSNLNIVGWDMDFDNVRASLHLPSGWKALHVTGADQVSSTWIGRWSLYKIFLVLVTAVAVYKLISWKAGVVSLLTMLLVEQEMSIALSVIFILAMIALARVLKDGKFKSFTLFLKSGALIIFVIVIVSFMVTHMRSAIYPQIDSIWHSKNKTSFLGAAIDEVQKRSDRRRERYMYEKEKAKIFAAPVVPMIGNDVSVNDVMSPELPAFDEESDFDSFPEFGSRAPSMPSPVAIPSIGQAVSKSLNRQYMYDSNNIVQTGYGVQDWRGNVLNLTWNGPVTSEEEVELYLLSPFMNMILAFVRVLLLVVLVGFLLEIPILIKAMKDKKLLPKSLKVFSVFLLAFFLSSGSNAYAVDNGFPSSKMLTEMQKYIKSEVAKKPKCVPECANVSKMFISALGRDFVVRLEVHAKENVAVSLPYSTKDMAIKSVLLNGSDDKVKLKNEFGTLLLDVEEGVHEIIISGLLSDNNSININLPMKPAYADYKVKGWSIYGIHENGETNNSIKLTKTLVESKKKDDSFKEKSLSPLLRVERVIDLGTSWNVHTTIKRLSPNDAPVTMDIPLIKGESVTSAGVRVSKGSAQVSMQPGQYSLSWSSVLDSNSSNIKLSAPKEASWVEVWKLNATNLWHVGYEGTPRIYPQIGNRGVVIPQWNPWPGEELSISVIRPKGVKGPTKTINKAVLTNEVGQRITEYKLDLKVLSSLGGNHDIFLPEGVELISVKVNHSLQPAELKDNVVSLNLNPGKQNVEVKWKQKNDKMTVFKTPEVNLNLPSVNIENIVKFPRDRWVLFTSNNIVGPAVLFWGVLPIIVLMSIILAVTKLTPLSTVNWFILLIGLSQVSLALNMVIVAWFLVMGIRKNITPDKKKRFRFGFKQFILACWTVVAVIGLFAAIQKGLLGSPNMKIVGNGSNSYYFKWFYDMSDNIMPNSWVLSFDIIVYRVVMLLWALWLAFNGTKWLKWGWECYSTGGYWLPPKPKKDEKENPSSKKKTILYVVGGIVGVFIFLYILDAIFF